MNNKGFTLIEMVVTTALVIVVLMITASAFESVLKSTGRIISSEESNIEGVIGLEMFRHDLQQAGYGLPHAFQAVVIYPEATVAPANKMNDGKGTSVSGDVPRAVASWEALTGASDASDSTDIKNILSGTDYLAIKAATVGRSKASQKWTYLNYTAGGKPPNTWTNSVDNFKSTDSVIVLNRTFSTAGAVTNTLVHPVATPAIYWPSNPTVNMHSAFIPVDVNQVHYLYGVDEGNVLGMPFNRADYFVARPSKVASIPSTCAPNTGILYKAMVAHGGGQLTYMPLLDCVADMQLVFGWDINGNGVIDESSAYEDDASKITVSSPIGTSATTIQAIMKNPADIRNTLKYIKVYVMAQEGRKDTNYLNTNSLMSSTLSVVVGEPGPTPTSNVNITKGYTVADLTAKGWLNYRWKIYRILVRPKNLVTN